MLVAQSCPTPFDPMVCPQNSPGKSTGVGSHSFLQRIFPTQRQNPGLLHCSQILYHLSYQGSPKSGGGDLCLQIWRLMSQRFFPPRLYHLSFNYLGNPKFLSLTNYAIRRYCLRENARMLEEGNKVRRADVSHIRKVLEYKNLALKLLGFSNYFIHSSFK